MALSPLDENSLLRARLRALVVAMGRAHANLCKARAQREVGALALFGSVPLPGCELKCQVFDWLWPVDLGFTQALARRYCTATRVQLGWQRLVQRGHAVTLPETPTTQFKASSLKRSRNAASKPYPGSASTQYLGAPCAISRSICANAIPGLVVNPGLAARQPYCSAAHRPPNLRPNTQLPDHLAVVFLPSIPQYWRTAPTEWRPGLGNPVSSMTHKPPSLKSIAGIAHCTTFSA